MRRCGWVCGVVVWVGCGTAKPEAAGPQGSQGPPGSTGPGGPSAPVVEEPAPVCLALEEFASLASTRLDGSIFELCAGGGTVSCVGYDLGTGALVSRPRPSDEELAARPRRSSVEAVDPGAVAAAKGKHRLCTADGTRCHDVSLGRGRPLWRSFSADGALVVYDVATWDEAVDAPSGHTFLVFEVATGKLVKRHSYADENYRCGGARFVDDLLLVAVDVCAGPGGIAWFMDPRTGQKVAEVGGGEQFGEYEPQPVVVGDKVAVLEQTGTRFSVHDRKSGAFIEIVDLVPGEQLDTEAYGNELWALPDGDLLIALNGAASGTVLRVDGATLALERRIQVPRCAAPE